MKSFLALAALLTPAFTVPEAQTYTPAKFVFKNRGPYSDAQLLASSGMAVGKSFTVDDLQKAAQRMIDSGAFEDLQPTLEGPFNKMVVTFTLKPVAVGKLLPATFENFVWIPAAELNAGLHKRVPLYDEVGIPEAGNLSEQVKAALAAMLAEKGVQAEVSATELEPTAAMPVSTWDFAVSKPQVVLGGVALSGVTPTIQAKVNEYLRTVVGKPYHAGHGQDADDVLLGIFRQEGYMRARLENVQRLPSAEAAGVAEVRIKGAVIPGDVYTVKSVAWGGAPELSTGDFEAANKLKPGDVATAKAVAESVGVVEDAYKSKGYLFVAVDPSPVFDDSAHTVSFAYKATPGVQYRMGNMSVVGLPPTQMAEFQSAWKLKPGDTYDNVYTQTFLRQNTALRSLAGYVGSFRTTADTNAKTVDVQLVFMRQGRQ